MRETDLRKLEEKQCPGWVKTLLSVYSDFKRREKRMRGRMETHLEQLEGGSQNLFWILTTYKMSFIWPWGKCQLLYSLHTGRCKK